MQMILSAVCDPTRRAALAFLWGGGGDCVCDLMARLETGPSGISLSHSLRSPVPLFIGFVSAGLPLGVIFPFLIAVVLAVAGAGAPATGVLFDAIFRKDIS